MQSFIVLGIIPGTNIQTNLNFWVFVYVFLGVVLLRTRLAAIRSFIQKQLLVHLIAHTINNMKLVSRA